MTTNKTRLNNRMSCNQKKRKITSLSPMRIYEAGGGGGGGGSGMGLGYKMKSL